MYTCDGDDVLTLVHFPAILPVVSDAASAAVYLDYVLPLCTYARNLVPVCMMYLEPGTHTITTPPAVRG